MENYGEFLFDASSIDMRECLEDLTLEDIELCCEYKIFQRGLEYFNDGMVEHLSLNIASNTVSATVIGSEDYLVKIYMDNAEVHATCTCPYYDVCKHVVAVLLNVESEGIESFSENIIKFPGVIDSLDFLKEHLEQLPKEELINLVMKFAPQNYVHQIFNNNMVDKEDSLKIFEDAEEEISGFFMDGELLCSPTAMNDALMSQLNRLSGLEDKLPGQTGNLLLNIMSLVNRAFDEGYLYIDDYDEEDYFESPEFNHFVISFIRQLPFIQKMEFVQKLNDTLEEMSYDTFEEIPEKYHTCFSKEESVRLSEYITANIDMFNDSFLLNIFETIKNDLPATVQEQVLVKLSASGNQKHLILLVELLLSQNRQVEAFNHLDHFLIHNEGLVDKNIIEFYLNIAARIDTDLERAALLALEHNKDENCLSFIKKLGVKNLIPFEQILRKDSPGELLNFYEKEKRFEDALQLISSGKNLQDYTLFLFFKKSKNHIPEQAEQYFLSRIDENLQNTGDRFYEKITESIRQIQQINSRLARDIIRDIQQNYKRRTKLMRMLSSLPVE